MWNLFRRLLRRDVSGLLSRTEASAALVSRMVGNVAVPSGRLLIADPQYVESPLRVEPTASGTGRVEAECLAYDRGGWDTAALVIRFRDVDSPFEELGSLPVDSAKALIIDEEVFQTHWMETGVERVGVVSTARSQELRRQLESRFSLKTVQVNAVRAEVIGPVSEDLEREIAAYLETIPEYAGFTMLGFRVDTDNSFERVNRSDGPWAYVAFGQDPSVTCLTCVTGYGDGSYPVSVRRSGREIAEVRIDFIDPETREQYLVSSHFDVSSN